MDRIAAYDREERLFAMVKNLMDRKNDAVSALKEIINAFDQARTLCDTGQLDPFELINQLQADKARLEGWLAEAMDLIVSVDDGFDLIGDLPEGVRTWWANYESNAEVR